MKKADLPSSEENETKPKCGIVMPISLSPGYQAGHWEEVLAILMDGIGNDFEVNLVSATNEVTVIQTTIVQNLADNEMVVCDVSSKNPNVMFELGIRLTFDKPTIIVMDDATDFSFDTSPIEHVRYPADLRFQSIVEFKEKLRAKVAATYATSISDPNFSPFLKHFARFELVPGLGTTTVSKDDFIVDAINRLNDEIQGVRSEMSQMKNPASDADTLPPRPYTGVALVFPSDEFEVDSVKGWINAAQQVSPGLRTYRIVKNDMDLIATVKFSERRTSSGAKSLHGILMNQIPSEFHKKTGATLLTVPL